MRKHLLASAFGITLALAAMPVAASPSFNIGDIQTAATTDLQAALDDATAHNDVFAMQCYSGALAYIADHPLANLKPNIKGVASAFQAARDGVKFIEASNGLVPPELVQACGPLALDAQNDIAKLPGVSIFGLHL